MVTPSTPDPMTALLLEELRAMRLGLNNLSDRLEQLETQQQQIIVTLETAPSVSSDVTDYLRSQQKHQQQLLDQQNVIRKNQVASAENLDKQNKWLCQEVGELSRTNQGRPGARLFENLEALGWTRLLLGILVIHLLAGYIQPHLPGSVYQILKLMDQKIFLIWRDQQDTQKFLGVHNKPSPSKN
jgi:hypothetical protein